MIEVVIVVLIIAVMLAVAIPSVISQSNQQQLRKAARGTLLLIRGARSDAITGTGTDKRPGPIQVSVDTTDATNYPARLKIVDVNEPTGTTDRLVDLRAQFSAPTLAITNDVNTRVDSVLFQPDGTATVSPANPYPDPPHVIELSVAGVTRTYKIAVSTSGYSRLYY